MNIFLFVHNMIKSIFREWFLLKCVFMFYFFKTLTQVQAIQIYDVDIAKSVNLTCRHLEELSAECTAKWEKDGLKIDTHLISRIFINMNHSLVISRVIEEDAGNYTCTVTCGSEIERFETILEVLNVPYQPQITGIVCNGILSVIRWNTISNPKVPVLKEKIQYKTNFQKEAWMDMFDLIPGTITQIEIKMNPWSNYTFRIISQNRIGESEPSLPTPQCTTPPDVPYKNPENVLGFGTNPHNLLISWDIMKPNEHNGPGFYYQVRYRLDRPDANWTEPIDITDWSMCFYEVINQETFRRYRIKVEAVNSLGKAKKEANEIIGFSGEDIPSIAPSNLTLLRVINSTAAEISWDTIPYSSINGYFKGFKIQIRFPAEDSSEFYEKIIYENITHYIIDTLKPFAKNLVQIFVCNEQYDSDPSNILTIETQEGVPGPVESIECESAESYSLHISWEKPLQKNGILKGYKFVWKKLTNIPEEEAECSKYVRDAEAVKTTLDVTYNTTYLITIMAMTSAGVGDPVSVECTTPVS